MTRGMWSAVYFGISSRSFRERSPIALRPHSLKRQKQNFVIDMGIQERSVNNGSSGFAFSTNGAVSWSTTEVPLTPEEEDAIVTLVVVVIGVIVAIVVLFSMGIFIDCKHQKKDLLKKKKQLKLKMPPLSRSRSNQKEDAKSLATDMCPTGASDTAFRTRDVIV